MTISARDIDHLTLSLDDPEAAATKLQQLGFNLTPEGVEPRCICFQPDQDDVPNYIELLQGDLAGLSLAMNVAELEGEERSHSWETEDGYEIEATVTVGEGGGPLPWLPVHHDNPDAFMEPEWIVHPNGALGMMAMHAVAANPKEVARGLKAAWTAKTEEILEGCMMVKAGAVELLIWSAAAYEEEYKAIDAKAPQRLPSIVGVTVAIERARPLQALLQANNIPFAVAEGDRVLAIADQAGNLMFEFLPQN